MSRCPQCDAQFSCAQTEKESAPCWCMALPSLPPDALDGKACLCPECLRTRLAQAEFTRSRVTPGAKNPA